MCSRYIIPLRDVATKSQIELRHAAGIVHGSQLIHAHNEVKGGQTFHAELAVIYKYLCSIGEIGLAKMQYNLWLGGKLPRWQKRSIREDHVKDSNNCN